MPISDKKQIYELINKSSFPLILFSRASHIDIIGCALSLYLMFKKINKDPFIACSFPLAEKFLFLPEAKAIASEIASERVYKISVNVGGKGLEKVSYDRKADLLNIYLTVNKGNIKIDSISLDSSRFKYDLILTLGVSKLEMLEKIYFENEEMFLSVPIINIGRGNISGEHFGLVKSIAEPRTHITEVVSEIIHSVLPSDAGDKIATLLLASLISATDNFQAPHINSRMFALAAFLIGAGADREEILKNLDKDFAKDETNEKLITVGVIAEK